MSYLTLLRAKVCKITELQGMDVYGLGETMNLPWVHA